MGQPDIVTKAYMRNTVVFADAFNYFLHGGRQVIQPNDLQEIDTTEIVVIHDKGNSEAVQKYRDVLKAATCMMDGEAMYLILGVENESDVKYAEPVKVGLYDFLQYSKQVQEIADEHSKAKDRKGHNSGEFLSGFYREDRLTPVITLVVFFGPGRWDGPRSLHEMMSTQNPDILKYVTDYRINLIEPGVLGEADLAKFQSNLRYVLGYIKYSTDGHKLREYLSKDDVKKSLKTLAVEAAQVINSCTNSNFKIPGDQEVMDVCKAIEEMNEEDGRKRELKVTCEHVINVVESFGVDVEAAMNGLKVPLEDRETVKKMVLERMKEEQSQG